MQRFPIFGNVSAAHWCGIVLTEQNSRVPGPTDIRLVGIVRLSPSAWKKVLAAGGDFEQTVPSNVPDEIRQKCAADAQWTFSEAFDTAVTGDAYSGRFYVDFVSRSILIDVVNPQPAT
ncbi:hypothetical protein ABZ297_16005 [Nonomuraea sp. NPDC005983]|uniref:hypothetical protein n=1 Tax=Nonomuraea sp. NPDC005983 TaxID=3155595 RepID=UPI0033BF5063